MDENPYQSPETAGAGQPGEIAVWLSRIVWFGLGVLGASAAAMGLLIVGMAIFQSTQRVTNDALFVLGIGLIICWMGAFLVWRAIKRFRRRGPARAAIP
jgi:predicted tellurium resistance membrane protein TerC